MSLAGANNNSSVFLASSELVITKIEYFVRYGNKEGSTSYLSTFRFPFGQGGGISLFLEIPHVGMVSCKKNKGVVVMAC